MQILKRTMKEEEVGMSQGEKSVRYSENRWVRGRLLGQGSFGRVHLAHHSPNHGMPAVTAVKSCSMTRSKQLINEKKLLKRFRDCPFIVRTFGDGDVTRDPENKHDLLLNVFLEFADGGSLLDLVSDSSSGLSEDEVRSFTKSILGAIEKVHEEGFVHRDIKPGNVLLFKQPQGGLMAKLADFGTVRPEAELKHGIVSGTQEFFSPEIWSSGVQGKPADIWALGCVVCCMLAGNHSKNLRRKLSDSVMDFIRKCREKDPNKRATAAMLMSHPFLAGEEEIKEKVIREVKQKEKPRYRYQVPPRLQKLQQQACCH